MVCDGTPSGVALTRAAASVVDDMADRLRDSEEPLLAARADPAACQAQDPVRPAQLWCHETGQVDVEPHCFGPPVGAGAQATLTITVWASSPDTTRPRP